MSSTTHTTREQRAEEAYLRAYGAHEGATEEQRAWGLKCAPDDALLSILEELYPEDFAVSGAAGIYTIRATPELNRCADVLDEHAQEGLTAAEVVSRTLPDIDAAMSRSLLARAEELGLDVEAERCDWYFVAEMIDEVLALPGRERPSAVAACNDGATPAARHLYREEA